MQLEPNERAGLLRLLPAAVADFAVVRSIVTQADEAGVLAIAFAGAQGALEPLTLLAALAPITARIGLVAEIDPAETHPYTAARRLAALDHVSHGRIGWSLAGDIDPLRRQDYVAAVHSLWDSWDDDVHRFDKAGGTYIDTSGIGAARHAGPFYRVAGPLDIPRPPQGRLPRIGADAQADVSDGHWHPLTAALAQWQQLRGGVQAHPRPGQSLRQRLGLALLAPNTINGETRGIAP